ncbi:MAG TPA: thioesterase family protein [Myxococcales bacterium]|jgi:1,4-dihydroxy-2-naphthoyl-CoA hydrolase
MAFEHSLRVRFQHTDPAGIVFFGNVLVFCHEAYEELLRAGGLPLDRIVAEGKQVLPLGHAEVTFKRPIQFGQLVRIRVAVGRVGERSFRLEYDLYGEDGAHLATAATVHVAVDPATRESVAISPVLRELLSQHVAPSEPL